MEPPRVTEIYRLRNHAVLDPSTLPPESPEGIYFGLDGSIRLWMDGVFRDPSSSSERLESDAPTVDLTEEEIDALWGQVHGDSDHAPGAFLSLSRAWGTWLGDQVATCYDDPWEGVRWGKLQRRKLRGERDIFSGKGMNSTWRNWYVTDGVVPRLGLVRKALPEALSDGLSGLPKKMAKLLLQRKPGTEDSSATKSALRKNLSTFPASVTTGADESRSPAWLVNRMLNGMLPCPLRKVDDEGKLFDVAFAWKPEWLHSSTEYVLPDVTARLRVTDDASRPRLDWIDFSHRDGASTRIHYESGESSPKTLQERGRWAFASTYLMAAEVQRHIALGHLITESILVDVETTLSRDNPVSRLLRPRLQRVDVANHIGDALVWGPLGVMVMGSALSSDGLAACYAENVGAFDWKGFLPCSKQLTQRHYAPKVQARFWTCVNEYVSNAMTQLGIGRLFPQAAPDATAAEHRFALELQQFAKALVKSSVPHHPLAGQPRSVWFDPSELAEKSTNEAAFSDITTLDDLKQFLAFTIYCATLGHGWANIRQYDEGGEPEYATFGLRARVDDPLPAGSNDAAWLERARPTAADIGNQLIQGHVLSFLPVGTIGEEDVLRGESLAEELEVDPLEGEASFSACVEKISAELVELRVEFGDQHVDEDRIPARPNA